MDRFFQDIRFALRTLTTRRAFSVIAIVTLALGIGITTAIFSVVNGILLRPLPFRESDRIVSVWETNKKEPLDRGQMSHPNYLDVQTETRAFEAIAEYSPGTFTLTGDGAATVVPGASVTPGFFRVFGVNPAMGRDFTLEEDRSRGPKVVIVSHSYWKERLGGRPNVLGTTIGIGGTQHQIVGVAPQGFDFPDKAKLWTPLQNDDKGCGRGCSYMMAAGRLARGATVESATQELEVLAGRLEQLYPKSNADVTLRTATLQQVIVGDVQTALYVLLGAVGMVLLIACANVANLLLVRGAARRSELAVRSVIGATRSRILAQLMTENLVLALCAGILGVGLASWAVDVLRSLAPSSIPRTGEVGLDGAATLFALALVLVTALLFGLAPALQLSRQSLSDTIRESGRGGDGSPRRFTRSAILVAEVALSVMLLLGAGLLMRSFTALNKVDPGFKAENLSTFTISLPSARYPTADQHVLAMNGLREKLKTIPGVQNAGIVLGLPLGEISFGTDFKRLDLPEPKPGDAPGARFAVIDPAYLSIMSIPVKKGRAFTDSDRNGSLPVTLISEATAREYFKDVDPIGKVIHIGVGLGYPNKDVNRTIVGVVSDVSSSTLRDPPRPTVYVPMAQTGQEFTSYVVQSANPTSQVLGAVRAAVREFDNDIAVEYDMPVQKLLDEQLATPRFYLALISLFAVLAALLAAVGIYGVVSYLVANRTREIGIRMALGAQAERVVKLIVWQGLKPALIGVGIGLAGALATVRIMESLLFGVKTNDVLTYAGVTAVLIAIVLIACAVPAHRAARIAPGVALRND